MVRTLVLDVFELAALGAFVSMIGCVARLVGGV